MKPQNCSLPRYMTPTNFNVQAVDLLERMLQRDFQVVSGRTDPVAGMPSAFPLSSEQAVGSSSPSPAASGLIAVAWTTTRAPWRASCGS